MTTVFGEGATRASHLAICKQRALEYVERSSDFKSLMLAMTSMASDLSKHPDTKDHPGIAMGYALLINRHLDSPQAMREFIEGFN